MDRRPEHDALDQKGPEVDDLHQLELDRSYNDQKLKSRFEHIFRKYEHDFEGVGDEIDIASGDIVVDNGHLQHMRHEADPGKSASSRFVKTFTEKLGYEYESSSEDGEEEDEDTDEDDEDEDEQSRSDGTSKTSQEAGSQRYASSHRVPNRISPRKAMNAFGHLARPAPRLAHLLVGEGTPQPALPMATENANEDDSSIASIESASGTSTPTSMLSKVPALQDSMHDLQSRAKRSAVGPEAIEALGVSIANQLAQLMAGPSSSKRKKPRAKEKKTAKQSVWDYPDLEPKRRKKRRRSPSPVAPRPLPSSPAPGSPGEESLWAPEGSVRPSKRLRREREWSEATPAVTRSRRVQLPSSGRKEVRRCWNCSLTSTPSWKTGPHGQDLCESCARYYLHNRRMKPFDSPTPSVGDEEDREDDERAQNATPSPNRSRPHSAKAGKTPSPALATTRTEIVDDSEEDEVVRNEHAVHQSKHYFYRSLPAEVPEPQPHMAPWPGENPLYASLAAREVSPPTFQPEGSSRQSPQRVPYSDIATQPSGLDHEHPRLVQKRPQHQQQSVYDNRHVPYSNIVCQEISDDDDPPDRLDDVHRENTANDGATHLQSQTSDRAFNLSGLTPSSSTHHESGYLANTSRTLMTSPRKGGRFTMEEDTLLIRLKEQEKLTWDKIALYFPHRSEYAIAGRYNRELKSDRSPARTWLQAHPTAISDEDKKKFDSTSVLREDLAWNQNQDELLLELREDQELEWDEIASLLPGHTPEAVEERYRLLAQQGLEQHAEQHDMPILKLGEHDEPEESRSNLNLRFSAEEDALIVRLREVKRLRWSELAKSLRHRPLHSIQRRYSRCLAARIRSFTPTHSFDTIKGTMEDRILAVDPQLGGGAPYEPDEDYAIRTLKEIQGLSWDGIASRLSGRTADAVRHRYEYKFGADAAKAEAASKNAERQARKAQRSILSDVADLPGVGVIQFAAPPVHPSPSASPPQHSFNHSLPRITVDRPFVVRDLTQSSTNDDTLESQPSAALVASSSSTPKSSTTGPGSRTPFAEDEDDAILQLKEMQGLSWEAIAMRLPGRSAYSISCRYTENLRPTRAVKNKGTLDLTMSESAAMHSSHNFARPLAAMAGSTLTQLTDNPVSSRNSQDSSHASAFSSHLEPSKLKTRPRKSLPSALPSTSRSRNLLLRRALDNSLRRRSDLVSTSISRDENVLRARDDSDSDQEAPSQQLLEEMETSLNSPSPATRTAPNLLSHVEQTVDPLLLRTSHSRTNVAIAAPYQSLAAVTKVTDRPSAKATTSSQARADGASSAPDPAVGQRWQTYPNLRFREVKTIDNTCHSKEDPSQPHSQQQTQPPPPRPQPQRAERPRRAAFDSASRRNSELLTVPLEETAKTTDSSVIDDTQSPSPRRNFNGGGTVTSSKPFYSGSKGQDQEDGVAKVKRTRGRPRGGARNERSPLVLILNAFKTSRSSVLRVKDIYALIEADKDMDGNWKSGIRAALSHDPSFEHAVTDEGRKGWQLTDIEYEVPESLKSNLVPRSRSPRRKVTFKSNEDAIHCPNDNDDDNESQSTSVIDEDGALIVSVGPKQRRIVSSTDVGKFKYATTSTDDDLPGPTNISPGTLIPQAHDSGSRPTPSKGVLKRSKAPKQAAPSSIEIANSDDEEELTLEASVHEDDELDLPTSPPSRRGSFVPVAPSDISRDPLSSDAIEPPVKSSSSKEAPNARTKALPSSSPLFMKPHTPASAFTKRLVTPRPSLTRLSQLRKETPARTGSPAAIFVNRSASVASSRQSSLGKRVVETPVREVDSDEDELA